MSCFNGSRFSPQCQAVLNIFPPPPTILPLPFRERIEVRVVCFPQPPPNRHTHDPILFDVLLPIWYSAFCFHQFHNFCLYCKRDTNMDRCKLYTCTSNSTSDSLADNYASYHLPPPLDLTVIMRVIGLIPANVPVHRHPFKFSIVVPLNQVPPFLFRTCFR